MKFFENSTLIKWFKTEQRNKDNSHTIYCMSIIQPRNTALTEISIKNKSWKRNTYGATEGEECGRLDVQLRTAHKGLPSSYPG